VDCFYVCLLPLKSYCHDENHTRLKLFDGIANYLKHSRFNYQ